MTFMSSNAWIESKQFPFFIGTFNFTNCIYIPPHSHEFIEVVYVANGEGLHEYRGKQYKIRQGDVFIIEPYVSHGYLSKSRDLIVYNVIFQPNLIRKELEIMARNNSSLEFYYIQHFFRKFDGFNTLLRLRHHDNIEVLYLLEKLHNEFIQKEMGYRVSIKNKLIDLFVYLSRCYSKTKKGHLSSIQDEKSLFKSILKFIHTHYSKPLSLEEVSRLCAMSQSSFSAKFKQYFNKTFIEYRNEVRIEVAKDLLIHTEDKISSVSEQVGFQDLSFFNKLFKREVGLSPVKFRSKHKMKHTLTF